MKTIQAKVNPRLLTKASRLFTGTLEGRIIEILQNARRAGATSVEITNRPDGTVVVQDNGSGIETFAKLLDLGGSGWNDELEQSEDPAGVGLFSLAPREVTIRSKGQIVTIDENGWTGGLMTVRDYPEPVEGTVLSFPDEKWTPEAVERNAVFTGMQVVVDDHLCTQIPFVSARAARYPELGCRIEAVEADKLSPWHHCSKDTRHYYDNVLVNFHGQVVGFNYHPISEHGLHFLADLTGEPTDIRLMLPARTQLVENEAYQKLKAAIELEAYRFVQRRKWHRLPYMEYLRARELGIELPEAVPTFRVGLLAGDDPEPVQVVMPEAYTLDRCYRWNSNVAADDADEANVHLLAALGTFEQPFVPVEIESSYDGYSWAELPGITKVQVEAGKVLHEDWLWSGQLICVESLVITAHTTDGKIFRSNVPMAIPPADLRKDASEYETLVYVTPEAQERLSPSEIWHHFGGWNDGGDSYDTQMDQFAEDLSRFWDQLVGPDEHLRRRIMEQLQSLTGWHSVTAHVDGRIVLRLNDGTQRSLQPVKQRTPAGAPISSSA